VISVQRLGTAEGLPGFTHHCQTCGGRKGPVVATMSLYDQQSPVADKGLFLGFCLECLTDLGNASVFMAKSIKDSQPNPAELDLTANPKRRSRRKK
jgi:hypothetical protein